jgi:hypothetical protein
MRSSFLTRACAFGGSLFALAAVAVAAPRTISQASFTAGTGGAETVLANDPYTVFTGLANASNQFVLTENTTTPTADDRVIFNGVPELINNSFDSTATPTVVRTVTESDVAGPGSSRTMSVTVTGTGDLWPSGLASGTTSLVNGGFGIGLVLPASINGGTGSEGLAWDGATITALSMDFVDQTGPTNGVPIPLSFLNSPTAWNGTFGVVFSDSTSPTGVTGFNTTLIRLNVVYTPVPEPTTIACLLPLSGLVLRRRR